MASLPAHLVHQGFWIDYSHGSILGSIITVESPTANIVVVILSILTALAGSHLWDVIAFICFLRNATDQERDGVHHQQQFLLRNGSSPGFYAWECLKMTFYWRKHSRRNQNKLIFSGLLASFCGIGFIIAGIVSSQVVTTTNLDVQVQPPVCGHWPNTETLYAANKLSKLEVYGVSANTQANNLASQYAKSCYNTHDTGNTGCDVYSKKEIAFKSFQGPCPFPEACKLNNTATLIMDTGIIDSREAFGINVKDQDRIYLRIKATCGVIDTQPYQKPVKYSVIKPYLGSPLPENHTTGYYFGGTIGGPLGNLTMAMTSFQKNFERTYTLDTFAYYPGSVSVNNWAPIPEFSKKDADTLIFFMSSNAILFSKPVDDLIFSAHQPVQHTDNAAGGNITYYTEDHPSSVLGCFEQYQFCSAPETCTRLGGIEQALNDAKNLTMNAMQSATLRLFMYQMAPSWQAGDMTTAAELYPPPYKAMKYELDTGLSSPLPDDQWIIETKNLFSLSLAFIQQGIANSGTGPLGFGDDTSYYKYLDPPNSAAEESLCYSIKMRAPAGFSNINVFGLSFTVAICGLIILVNVITTPLAKWIARHNKPMKLCMRHWIHDGMFQVQRMAFEGVGRRGTWKNFDHDIPLTQNDETFQGLAVENLDSVSLSTSPSVSDAEVKAKMSSNASSSDTESQKEQRNNGTVNNQLQANGSIPNDTTQADTTQDDAPARGLDRISACG